MGGHYTYPDRSMSRRRPVTPPTDHSPSKSRSRMRCFIALGLILPALAAVIGVVAWAVSAEVIMIPNSNDKSDMMHMQGSGGIPYLEDRSDIAFGQSSVHNVAISSEMDNNGLGKAPADYYVPFKTSTPRPSAPVPSPSGEVNTFLHKIVSSSNSGNSGDTPPFVVIAPIPESMQKKSGNSNVKFDDEPSRSQQEPNRFGEDPSAAPPRPSMVMPTRAGPPMMKGPERSGPTFLPPPPPPKTTQHTPSSSAASSTRIDLHSTTRNHPPPPPPPSAPSASQRFYPPPPPPPPPHPQGPPPPGHHYPHPPPPGPPNNHYPGSYPPPPPPPPPPVDQRHQQPQQGDSNRWGSSDYSGEQHYEQPNKGVTISIGGGPHGGSYSGSPLGLMKSLFLPFLPKPRVNLNGRVVFGVVLEKGVGLGGNKQGHQPATVHAGGWHQ